MKDAIRCYSMVDGYAVSNDVEDIGAWPVHTNWTSHNCGSRIWLEHLLHLAGAVQPAKSTQPLLSDIQHQQIPWGLSSKPRTRVVMGHDDGESSAYRLQ